MSWFSDVIQPGFTLAVTVAGSFMALSAVADTIANENSKRKLAKIIKKSWSTAIPAFWQSFIESLFGKKRFGLRAFVVSIIVSVSVCFLLNVQHAWSNTACAPYYESILNLINLGIIFLLVNGIGDFLSLAKTRFVIDRFIIGSRSLPKIVLFFLGDFIAGVLIFLFSFTILVNFGYLVVFGEEGFLWNVEAFLSSMKPSNILDNAYVTLTELKNYGIYLSGTNRITTGAYLYSSLLATLWGAMLFIPLVSISIARGQHFIVSSIYKFWNIKLAPYSYLGFTAGSFVFLALFVVYVVFGTIAGAFDLGLGDEIGCRCTESCSSNIP